METSQSFRTTLNTIVDKLAREYQPRQIILYGSQVRGTPNQGSDIDLLIVKDSHLSPYQRVVHVRRLLRDPQRLIPLDLIVVTPSELEKRLKRGDQFLQAVVSQGQVLYAT
jgi:predicted nucleotidyltransferase